MMSGDFHCGLPEETEGDFQATSIWLNRWKFAYAYSFKYSTVRATRPPAAPQVDAAEADGGLQRLSSPDQRQQRGHSGVWSGRDLSVLVEKAGRNAARMLGQVVIFCIPVHIGQFNCAGRPMLYRSDHSAR